MIDNREGNSKNESFLQVNYKLIWRKLAFFSILLFSFSGGIFLAHVRDVNIMNEVHFKYLHNSFVFLRHMCFHSEINANMREMHHSAVGVKLLRYRAVYRTLSSLTVENVEKFDFHRKCIRCDVCIATWNEFVLCTINIANFTRLKLRARPLALAGFIDTMLLFDCKLCLSKGAR